MPPLRESADLDGALAFAPTDHILLGGMRSGGQLLRVGEAVAVRIAQGAIVQIPRSTRAHTERSIVERIEPVLIFPTVRQTVAVGVEFERVGLRPLLANVVNAVCVRVAIDHAVEVLVFAKAVAQSVFVRVRLRRTGFGPRLPIFDFVVRPGAFEPRLPCRLDRRAISVHPAVAVVIFDAVRNTVVVRVRIGRIGHGAGCLAGAVVTLIKRADTGHFAIVGNNRIERRIEVGDEVFEAVTISVRVDVGHVGIGQSPAHLESIG